MKEKFYKFYFHYNKPATQRCPNKRVCISVHYKDKCYIVNHIKCFVPCYDKVKEKQPRFVMEGFCKPSQFIVKNNTAYIAYPYKLIEGQ